MPDASTTKPSSQTAAAADTFWYKDAVVYQLHVKSFFDGNDDGIGDFAGLIQKLDYLADLGVSAVWLLPFYPSPLRDDGYDIADYRSVHAPYGTMREVRAFLKAAHARGLKVITELVINHTSDQHPWFQRARAAPRGSVARNFYVWSDDDKKWPETRIIFTDTEPSNWTWDPVAEQYYWHRFFSHQPDLNFDNPKVVEAVIAAMRFWLDLGVDGLRLDAIPYLVERDGTNNENLPETIAVLKQLRAAMDETHPHAFFLAEANQWPEDTAQYFGDGDVCHMAFHFPLMPRMYMAIAQEDRHPIADILRQTPDIPANCQWAVFLRNHDELTLEMVTDRERDYLWATYAADRRARLNLGIRRRLAPLLGNDRRKIELMNSLLFSMPGTPVVYYGDEIGMGDNIHLGDRDGVRTPMQWSPDRNGGFSRADPAELVLPAIMGPIHGFAAINVEAGTRDPASLLNWTKRLMQVRQQQAKVFGRGSLTLLYPGNRKILAYLREFEDTRVLCVANLSRQAQAVELDLSAQRGRVPVELLGRSAFPPIGDLPYLLTLPAYGFYWFVLAEVARLPAWHEAVPEPLPDFVTLILREEQGWAALTEGRGAQAFVREVLPGYFTRQHWYPGAAPPAMRMAETAKLPAPGGNSVLATVIEVGLSPPERWFLPFVLRWDESAVTTQSPVLPYTMAKIRKGPRLGALIDAGGEGSVAPALVEAMRQNLEVPFGSAVLRCTGGSNLAALPPTVTDTVRRLSDADGVSTLLLGDTAAVLKLRRRLLPGPDTGLAIARFLTERARFAQTPPWLGCVEEVPADGPPTTLAVLTAAVRNQGDSWTFTSEYLKRELEELALGVTSATAPGLSDRFAAYGPRAHTLGARLAALHLALAAADDADFAPEPIVASVIEKQVSKLADALPDRQDEARRQIAELAAGLAGLRIQVHGALDLKHVLVDQADYWFVDFAGTPAKEPPLRDLATLLRSLDRAAWAAAAHAAEGRPEKLAELQTAAFVWRDQAAAAAVAGYRDAGAAALGLPEDAASFDRALSLFVLEQALAELAADAAKRPGGVDSAIRAATAILDRRPA